MAATDIIVEGLSFLRLCPLTVSETTGKLTGLGTAVDIARLEKEGWEIGSATSDPEYKEKVLTNRVKLRLQVSYITIDPATGETVSAKSDATDKIDVTAVVGKTDLQSMITIMRSDAVYAAMVGLGVTAAGENAGYLHLIGKISGSVKGEIGSDGYVSVALSIAGGKSYVADTGFDYQAYNTKMCASITPFGKSAITPTATVAADMTEILKGRVTLVD